MKTRHPYMLQDSRIIVLEHIVTIDTADRVLELGVSSFYVNFLGDICYNIENIKFEKSTFGHYLEDGTQEVYSYKTTERNELIKALAAI